MKYFLFLLFVGCAALPSEPKCIDITYIDFNGNVSTYHCGVLVSNPVNVVTGK